MERERRWGAVAGGRPLRWGRGAALLLWGTLLLAWLGWSRVAGLSSLEAARLLAAWLEGSTLTPLLYLAAYLLRPLLFFPATLLTVMGGALFGAVGGTLLTVVGANGSALVAYAVGRWLGQGALAQHTAGTPLAAWMVRLRRNSFEAVLTMRFLFLPYDAVNYLCGALRVRPRAFVLATALGSLPGTVAFVLAGASLQGGLLVGAPRVDGATIVASLLLFGASLGVARWLRRREAQRATPDKLAHESRKERLWSST